MALVRRREFLAHTSRAAFGASWFAVAGFEPGGPEAPGSKPFLDSLTAGWDKDIDGWLRETRLPSASVALIHDGKLAWRKAYGVKDTGTTERADTNTVYAACSNTKPVFAYAVTKLSERGVMDLDTPLIKYLPERIVDDPRGDLITARHVLNHTTGFPNWRRSRLR